MPVFNTLTCTVLLASVRARVKSPHIAASKRRFRPKKKARTRYSKGFAWSAGMERMEAREAAMLAVREVVVL